MKIFRFVFSLKELKTALDLNKKINIKSVFYCLIFLLSTIVGCKDSNNKTNQDQIKKGQELFSNVGCVMCHSLSGEKRYGPPLNTIFNKKNSVIRDSTELKVTVDRAYLKRSITDPDFEKPIDFQESKMAKTTLTNNDIDCIVDYLISVNIN